MNLDNAKSVKYYKNFEDKISAVDVIFNADSTGIERKLSIPLVEENTDYQEILKWVAEGNTIEEAD
tara:strand:- start:14 stop:211 length:198 start_codon:yes stop_codon:yes gene_type:complete